MDFRDLDRVCERGITSAPFESHQEQRNIRDDSTVYHLEISAPDALRHEMLKAGSLWGMTEALGCEVASIDQG